MRLLTASAICARRTIRLFSSVDWLLKETHFFGDHSCKFAFHAVLLLLLCATGCSRTSDSPPTPFTPTPSKTRHLTFVQWTDPHVFDPGKGRHAEGVREEELDNWAAFHWAVLETNQLVLTERQNVDFVVITGDFGLENVQLPNEQSTNTKNNGCHNRKATDEGPIDRVSLADAAASVARELDALLVKQVYLVPGNNDVCDENPNDLPRWAWFVAVLQQDLEKLHNQRIASLNESAAGKPASAVAPPTTNVVDLTDTLARLSDSQRLQQVKNPRTAALFASGQVPIHPAHVGPQEINGITLLGLDTAFFKNSQTPANAEIADEIKWVSQQIRPGDSYVVFTHIPDLNDPYVPAGSQAKPSWGLTAKLRQDWKTQILGQSGVLGIFAGHFHVANRDIYPHNFLYSKPDELTAAKLWLAPPLAEKYQWRSPPGKTARGMLLVSVNGDGDTRVSPGRKVQPSAIWYSTLDQGVATVGDNGLAEARAAEQSGRWDEAAKADLAVLNNAAADSRTRATALEGYELAQSKMRSWWWQSVLARWFYVNGLPMLYSAAIVVLTVAVLTIGNWALKLLMRLVGYSGRAFISDTVELTAGAPVKEFAARLQSEGDKVRRRLIREREGWAAGHVTLLVPASSSIDSLLDLIPKVETVDISSWLKFIVGLLRLFRWTVKTGLAVYPPSLPAPAPPLAAEADVIVQNAELNAYAVVQWGWIVRVRWWRQRCVGNDRSALKDLARELAELIVGETFV